MEEAMRAKLVQAVIISALCFSTDYFSREAVAETARASMTRDTQTDNAVKETYAEIQSTFGLVPSFIKQYPKNALPSAWATMKSVQLNDKTAIPPKYKELMGVALAAQIPCHYCSFFHTEAAKLNGATPEEIAEAVAIAGLQRQWAVIINGSLTDPQVFKDETTKMMGKIKENISKGTPPAAVKTTTKAEAYRDMENTFGVVPTFVKSIPDDAIAPLWEQSKALLFSPNTAIPLKYKDLITLGISTQIPCPYCVYMDTECAKADGAIETEINEAIFLSGTMRHWSAVINGLQIDEATFKREITQAFNHIKKAKK